MRSWLSHQLFRFSRWIAPPVRVDPPPDCDAFEQDWGPKDNNLVGQVRRLGETGPVYVVLRLVGGDHAEIEIPVTGEKITLTVAEILANPQE